MFKKIRNIIEQLRFNQYYLRRLKFNHLSENDLTGKFILFRKIIRNFLSNRYYREIYPKTDYKKIKLKDIPRSMFWADESKLSLLKHTCDHDLGYSLYDWESLEKSVQKYGALDPITVRIKGEEDNVYSIIDGNHRYVILRELYGGDYEITVKIIKTQ